MNPQDYINGCDAWFNGIGNFSWKFCCDLHDIAYTSGGDSIMRLAADLKLVECVNSVAGPMGIIMGIGVLSCGWLFFRYTKLGGRNLWEVITRSKNAKL